VLQGSLKVTEMRNPCKLRQQLHTHKPIYRVLKITHYGYVRVTESYTETLHVKKMADLVAVSQ